MSTLRRQESAGAGLQRLVCTKVETAIRCLTRQPGQSLSAVAAVREAEALLALLEPELPRPVVRRDRAILARLLEGLEEMTLPAQMLERLEKRYKKTPDDAAMATAVKALGKRWAAQSKSGLAMSSGKGSFNPAIYRLVADMAELRGHAGTWPIDDIRSDAPPRGLRRTYTKARKQADQATTARSLGGLITSIQQLEHQIGVISKASPTLLKAQRKLLHRAAEALTEVSLDDALDRAIAQELGTRAGSSARSLKTISQDASADLAQALAETPAAFSNRVQVYWSVWRGSA